MRFSTALVAIMALSIGACSSDPESDIDPVGSENEGESSLDQSLTKAQDSTPTDMGRDLAMLHAQPGTWQVFPADGSRPFRIARREGEMAHVVRLDFPSGYTSNILSLNCEPLPTFRGIDTRSTKNDIEPVRQGMDADLSDYSLVEVARQLCSGKNELRSEEGRPAKVIETLRSEILSAKRPEGR